jgi:hypothetical protein
MDVNVRLYFTNMRYERGRGREQMSKCPSLPSPKSLDSIYRVCERVVYLLFYRWSEILQVGP